MQALFKTRGTKSNFAHCDAMTMSVYCCLKEMIARLLSRNRNITVLDCFGHKISNGTTIYKLYAVNQLYNGSAKLVKESASLRPLLVATALAENASSNVQHTALLLSDHTDVLCEFMDGADFDRVAATELVLEGTVARVSIPSGPHPSAASSKRRKGQPSRAAAKKARK